MESVPSTVSDYSEAKPEAPSESGSSLFGGYTILAKSMMGSGLLGVAAACAKDGWILGGVISAVIPLLTFLSLHLLTILAIDFSRGHGNPVTFYKLCESVLGRAGGWLVEIALILKTFGASIVYLQVAGSMLSSLIWTSDMSISAPALTRLIQIGLAAVFAPFCFLEKITNTKYINTLGIGCLVYILVIACVYFDPKSEAVTSLYPQSFLGVLSKVPIFVFAYACHQNVFACVHEVRKPTIRRMDLIMALSCLTGFLIYLPVMAFPYATYGSEVKDNFLKNLPASDAAVKIAFVCAAVSVSVSFPLQILPLRNTVCGLMFLDRKVSERHLKLARYGVATAAILAALGIALAVSSLGIVMAATGLVGGNTVCFLAPSLLYVRRFKRDHSTWYLAAGLVLFSLALYPLCLVGIALTA